MRYQLRDKEPTDLKIAQETAIKIDKNMQTSGKSNLPGFTRGSSSRQLDPKENGVGGVFHPRDQALEQGEWIFHH
jgi:hypothetical protein